MLSGTMIIRIGLDTIFPPPPEYSINKKTNYDVYPENKFELIFDEELEQPMKAPGNVTIEIEQKESDEEL